MVPFQILKGLYISASVYIIAKARAYLATKMEANLWTWIRIAKLGIMELDLPEDAAPILPSMMGSLRAYLVYLE